jgi:site-specific DNA-methyltransferase (cytosine-N4-specific)
MITRHEVVFRDSKNLDMALKGKVDLVVTSPPYPMIKMWDEIFSHLNPDIQHALNSGDGWEAYHLMNQELDKIWCEVDRLTAPGGIVCINIGDATRKIGGHFQLYSNHSHIIRFFENMGYQVLPHIIWKKESNKPTKFMGSGMIPPNAYITLEHEYILIFRKKGPRRFDDKSITKRKESSYFWEERNTWFSDLWQDLKGAKQKILNNNLRNHTAAFPIELPFRLINMFSIQGDLILDPFLGTGTTTMAAAVSARNSVGYEIEKKLLEIIDPRFKKIPEISQNIINERIDSHQKFTKKWINKGKKLKYNSINYNFGVISKSEEYIRFPLAREVIKTDNSVYDVIYA